ncbi:DegT/DnrJ/EryC1/StrS aminotransferase family protein [Oceanihabitans sediminis]|uniref:DegT/DnrJ/EryC1/StrS family aminotransferase n=1 Tax=Oceanihabitans sediminis TaxID=1812012 RepID=A0A368P6C7_9FLAO|nr:DegT/DnrJ/EryC1/StrS family aminotransferase [Oceanihabitans sediminis]MDX1277187.1 DegT/DnrJ/EryC1/StrS family aminotransferase [Oceanihabitans sediminis]MDX1773605.1 DegT/DnrJ/EryC1/StrS family aminotransferase [Oceanihabitans sediminis]RBP33049.1 dTDP-4-amino-4,6-dideoxygalactose transaminase [Oceanihabitans sediminis]RCU57435.1 DegT/DnrJ/EryC1/StrS family aminotransferase [Oceanihabitans sediminis]
MKIPFSPPFINHAVIQGVTETLQSGWITTGPKVKKLEELICFYTKSPNALGVNSATSGLMLALKWYGIGEGDEVIVPSYTYAATALAVVHVGATPILVDVEDDFNISVKAIRNAITEDTKAIIPVDIAGWPCDYDAINNLVDNTRDIFHPTHENQKKLGRILIISDAAHAIGAQYKNKFIGATTDITVFSFHAVKNITTAEGGAVCLNLPQPFDNQEEYNFLRCFSLNGQTKDAFTKSKAGGWRYDIIYPGLKMNLPDLLAAVGVAQLPEYFDTILNKRKEIFQFYQDYFSSKEWAILPPFRDDEKISSCHLYALRINGASEYRRDAIIDKIAQNDVAVNVHFQPLPLLSLFKSYGYEIKDFPVAYNNYKSEISLPIYPQLNKEQLHYIVNTITNAVETTL